MTSQSKNFKSLKLNFVQPGVGRELWNTWEHFHVHTQGWTCGSRELSLPEVCPDCGPEPAGVGNWFFSP